MLLKNIPMAALRYLSPLVLALSLAARPSLAQQADLTPLLPVRPLPRLPAAPGQVAVRRPAMPATPLPVASAAVGARQWPALVLLNSRLIAGLGGLGELKPKDIEKIDIYKGGDHPGTTTPAQWRGLDANGIIAVTLRKKARLKSQTLAQLGRHLQAKRPVSYTINGLPTANGALHIITASIEEIKMARTATGTIVGVWLLQGSSQPTKTYPPGTILIRGTAYHHRAEQHAALSGGF